MADDTDGDDDDPDFDLDSHRIGEIRQDVMQQSEQITQLTREVRSLRKTLDRVLKAVEPPRETNDGEDDED